MLHDPYHRPPPTPHDLAATLRSAAIFSRFTDAQLRTLVRRTRLVCLGTGEILFRHGERTRALYLLVQGQLKLYRTSPDGKEVIIDLLDPGTTFGETRILLEDPHWHVSGAALGEAEVAAVDLPTFLTMLHGSIDTSLVLLRRISERAERYVDDIERLALQSGVCRVASYLLGQLPPGRAVRSNEVATDLSWPTPPREHRSSHNDKTHHRRRRPCRPTFTPAPAGTRSQSG